MAEPKHIAALIADSIPPDAGSGDMSKAVSASTDDSDSQDEQAAAEDMMSAFDSKDPAALASALKSFVEICMNKSY